MFKLVPDKEINHQKKSIVSPYAAPAREINYTGLPPAYTFVGNREPFYSEICTYIENLKAAGIKAEMKNNIKIQINKSMRYYNRIFLITTS